MMERRFSIWQGGRHVSVLCRFRTSENRVWRDEGEGESPRLMRSLGSLVLSPRAQGDLPRRQVELVVVLPELAPRGGCRPGAIKGPEGGWQTGCARRPCLWRRPDPMTPDVGRVPSRSTEFSSARDTVKQVGGPPAAPRLRLLHPKPKPAPRPINCSRGSGHRAATAKRAHVSQDHPATPSAPWPTNPKPSHNGSARSIASRLRRNASNDREA